MKGKKGLAAVPVIIGFAVVILIIGYWWFKKNVEPVTAPKPAASARLARSSGGLAWSGQVAAGGTAREAISLAGGGSFDLTLTGPAGAGAIFRWSNGEAIAGLNPQVAIDPDGQAITSYHFDQAAGGEGNLQVEIHNETGTTPTDYEIMVPPIDTSSTTTTITPTGQGINISITLQETIDGQVLPVTGATVIAIITSPSGLVYTLPLAEGPSEPGTYTGYFGGNQEAGVYRITYQISGLNHDGTPFTQETDAEFLSTGLPPESVPGASDWTKIFDINLSGSIQLIGY